jgi:hypothetical protein
MKRLISLCLIASTIALSPARHAVADQSSDAVEETQPEETTEETPPQEPQETAPSAQESTTPEAMPPDEDEEEGTLVGQAANEGSRTAKSKQWQNIALATAAVVVAITALILVADNDGHRSED